MGQITKEFAQRMLDDARREKHTPLTCHEQEQLAYAWLQLYRQRSPSAEQLRQVTAKEV